MKILSIVTQLEGGGAQMVAHDLHKLMAKDGFTSKLIFLYEKDSMALPERNFISLKSSKPEGLIETAKIFSSLIREISIFKPDTIITHTHYSNCIGLISSAASRVNAKIIAVHHNTYESYPLTVKIIDKIIRILKPYSKEVTVSDSSFKSFLENKINTIKINNGIKPFNSMIDRENARLFFNLDEKEFIACAVGRLSAQKNHKFLIDLAEKISNIKILIAGEGELRQKLSEYIVKKRLEDRIILLGAIPKENIPILLKASDLFLMPSLFEGLSIAMLEAFSSGTPFIGSDTPAISSIINGNAGRALPLDTNIWAAEIKNIMSSKEDLKAISDAQIQISKQYTLECMYDNYKSIIIG